MKNKTHVPDKLEAYLLQVRHALYNLISLEDGIVSVEYVDDVAIENSEITTLEQTKNAISSNNPLANRSVAFWKTIYNWCYSIKNGEIRNEQVKLKYVVVSSHNLNIGEIPNRFFNSTQQNEVEEAIDFARSELYEDGKLKISDSCKKYIEFCFLKENRKIFVSVIKLMSLELHSDSYDDDLINKFKNQIIPIEYADELLTYMLGWVDKKIHQYTKENKPAFISIKEYREELAKQSREKNTNTILCALSTRPSEIETGTEVSRRSTYIKQLELIELDSNIIFRAANDYLSSKSQIVEWADKGLVTEGSYIDYKDSLIRTWEMEKLSNDSRRYDSDVAKGQVLYSETQKTSSNKLLQGKNVPSFFASGVLQDLANEPKYLPVIGWHPKYKEILETLEEEKND